jgi:hypothetical protein
MASSMNPGPKSAVAALPGFARKVSYGSRAEISAVYGLSPLGARSGHRTRAQVEAELGPGTDGLVWVLWQAKADFVLRPRLARAARHKLPFTRGDQLAVSTTRSRFSFSWTTLFDCKAFAF